MTIDELIKELSELSERGFGSVELRKHIPILYTDKDGTIYENMFRMKDEEFTFDSQIYVGNGSDYECIVLPYGGHEMCSIEEYKNDKEEWKKDLEDISMDEEDYDSPFSTDEDQ